MSSTIDSANRLLEQATQITQHHEEIRVLLGEQFNIFSILNMESAENATHSAFLGELLNPNGRHNMGSLLLKLFIEQVNVDTQFDPENCYLRLEKSVGKRDTKNKTGGRIDIYLEDRNGYSLSIENKIYASDQAAQIERYVNHNKERNTVLYLTLWGEDASDKSKGILKAGEDYTLLSYRDDILSWLEACQKEAVNAYTVRDSISQYITLIKKLTNQLTNHKMKNELISLIENNYDAALQISSQIENAEKKAAHVIFSEAKALLEAELGEGWTISIEGFKKSYGGMNLRHIKFTENVYVSLEGQSKVWKNPTVLGVLAPAPELKKELSSKGFDNLEFFTNGKRTSNSFYAFKYFLGWNQASERAKLFNPVERQNNLDYIVENTKNLALECLEKFVNNS